MTSHAWESIQQAASSKAAVVLGVTTATAPKWMEIIIGSPEFKDVLIVLGALSTLSIAIVNIQSVIQRLATNKEKRRQEKIRTALLEIEAKEKNIIID